MKRSNWAVTAAATGVQKGQKQDWRTLIRHTSPEIRALFEQLEAHQLAARAAPLRANGKRMSAKRMAREAMAAAAAKGQR